LLHRRTRLHCCNSILIFAFVIIVIIIIITALSSSSSSLPSLSLLPSVHPHRTKVYTHTHTNTQGRLYARRPLGGSIRIFSSGRSRGIGNHKSSQRRIYYTRTHYVSASVSVRGPDHNVRERGDNKYNVIRRHNTCIAYNVVQ